MGSDLLPEGDPRPQIGTMLWTGGPRRFSRLHPARKESGPALAGQLRVMS